MTERWDWADVAAVGVMAQNNARDGWAHPVRGILGGMANKAGQGVQMCARHRDVAAGIRYGYDEFEREFIRELHRATDELPGATARREREQKASKP